ncbi:TPA: hypothetical protein DCX16_04020 [bacterium]|nr:hypothetical protein [bacterium]
MKEVIILFLLIVIGFFIIYRIKEKRKDRLQINVFFDKAEKLISTFNQTAEKNIFLLEEKIQEANEVLNELDKKIAQSEEFEEKIKTKRFPEVFRLRNEGLPISQIAKKMNMSQYEIELILKQ